MREIPKFNLNDFLKGEDEYLENIQETPQEDEQIDLPQDKEVNHDYSLYVNT